MPLSALLTQKPDSPEPTAGESRRFTIETKQKKSGEGTWLKAKNEKEGYGESYKVLKAERIDDYTHPQHGTFHQFSLLLEGEEDAGAASSNGVGGAAPATSKDAVILRQVSAKVAGNLTAALVQSGALTEGNIGQTLLTLTDEVQRVIETRAEGNGLDSGKTYEEPNNPGPNDDPIPF